MIIVRAFVAPLKKIMKIPMPSAIIPNSNENHQYLAPDGLSVPTDVKIITIAYTATIIPKMKLNTVITGSGLTINTIPITAIALPIARTITSKTVFSFILKKLISSKIPTKISIPPTILTNPAAAGWRRRRGCEYDNA